MVDAFDERFQRGFRLHDGAKLNRLIDHINEIESGEVQATSDPNQIYGTNGAGDQATYPINEAGGVVTTDGTNHIPANLLPPSELDGGQAASEAEMLALDVVAPAFVIRTDFTPQHFFFLSADPASDINNWHDTGEFGAGAANPSATIGLTAKNGVANTYMRSDGAPAIDQTIAPTWTGAHKFTAVSTAEDSTLTVRSTTPRLEFSRPDEPDRLMFEYTNSETLTATYTNAAGDPVITPFLINAAVVAAVESFLKAENNSAADTSTFTAVANSPQIDIKKSNGAADAKRWVVDGSTANSLLFKVTNDAGTVSANYLEVDRTGAAIAGVKSNSGAGTWAHTGMMSVAFDATNVLPTMKVEGPTRSQLEIAVTGAQADQKRWDLIAIDGSLSLGVLKDDGTGLAEAWQIVRNGATILQQSHFAGAATSTLNANGRIENKPTQIVTGADGNKLWLAKYSSGTGHTDAPKTLGAASTYLQVGGREYGSLGFAGIGFGYVSAPTDNPCVWIGHEETQTAGNTAGDLVVATRPGTTNVAPTERLRVTSAGALNLAAGTTVGAYNGVATKGAGVAPIYGSHDLAAQAANVPATTLYAVPTGGGGLYRVSGYLVVTQAATTSSTLPSLQVLWTDEDTSVALSGGPVTPTNNANQLGAFGNGDIIIHAKEGTNVQFQTSNYASSGATPMQFAVHLKLEYLG